MSLNTAQGPYFGGFGGRFVAESLMGPLEEVEAAWRRLWPDPGFQRSLRSLFADYAGRPSLLTEAPRFASDLGGVRVLLKREDLNHTGSHKINNVLGQALLTRELGKTRVIAETGAGQHGVATATAAALMGLECTVYMGKEDTERQALNVARMQMLGAEVVAVSAGSATLKDAINEAFRDWVTNAATTNYVFGTAAGPLDGGSVHPRIRVGEAQFNGVHTGVGQCLARPHRRLHCGEAHRQVRDQGGVAPGVGLVDADCGMGCARGRHRASFVTARTPLGPALGSMICSLALP